MYDINFLLIKKKISLQKKAVLHIVFMLKPFFIFGPYIYIYIQLMSKVYTPLAESTKC